MSTIQLQPLHDEHWPILETFSLPLDQEKYTMLPRDLDHPLPEGVYPIVITAGKPVGFFLLHDTERVASYTNHDDALLLSAFSINHADQRQGYAKAALSRLPDYVCSQFPAVQEVVLSVNLKNEAAFALYEQVGFTDTGRRIDGPIGPQRIMSLKVNASAASALDE
ncbi:MULTISPECIES: GNAT family N-acetyltransferase [Exiguobacterium]|uniref:GNAT family N-acetyltransferase n=1 Tax=Exiguobacterium TaxID=33986 RepID=UPI001BE72A2C|nr:MULTISPECIES: GNAT family protein [Exiguobacterium]MCT4783621.1 GNAT family N-acetyltransferase [Exiguobacterium himgiriensis]